MPSIRVLAFSSSRVGNSAYLEKAVPVIKDILGDLPVTIAFVPYAAANNYQRYADMVREAIAGSPYTIALANTKDAKHVIEQADVIMVGGGNTFKLLHHLYQFGLVNLIRQKVESGAAYIGWSAGSNVAGLTIGTTNDMPVIEPESFKALSFFPFQINPHYINVKPEGHNGETRDERLIEYLQVNPSATIIALPEGTALKMEQGSLKLLGQSAAVLFKTAANRSQPLRVVLEPGANLSYLLKV